MPGPHGLSHIASHARHPLAQTAPHRQYYKYTASRRREGYNAGLHSSKKARKKSPYSHQ